MKTFKDLKIGDKIYYHNSEQHEFGYSAITYFGIGNGGSYMIEFEKRGKKDFIWLDENGESISNTKGYKYFYDKEDFIAAITNLL